MSNATNLNISSNLNYSSVLNNNCIDENNTINNSLEKSSANSSYDSVDINQKNDNLINSKKAYDAFKDTSSNNNTTLLYAILSDAMKRDGYNVPNFTADNNNTSEFIPFIDEMKDYAKNLIDGIVLIFLNLVLLHLMINS